MIRRARGSLAAAAALCLLPASAAADVMHEEPLVFGVRLDRLELAEAGAFAWRVGAAARRDLAQLRVESRGGGDRDAIGAAEVSIVYGRAMTAFLDVSAGWRTDVEPVRRDWFALGVDWLAPWHVEVEGTLYVGGGNRNGLRLEAEWALRLGDRLVLVPEAELEAWTRDDTRARRASGIATSELALDLRYEIARKLMPYIGVRRHHRHGETARNTLVAGIHAWY